MVRYFLLLLGVLALHASVSARSAGREKIAFPTAEGYGKYTVGGRGGALFEVTHLNDGGPGSLREAIEAEGPRTIVFRVSGTIDLERPLTIRNPYVTIAGQTAPGDGICLKRHPLVIDADEVIIRYIRVRLGDEGGLDDDAVSARGRQNIILDHVSASWSIDETLSVYLCRNVTIQWCMITESLYNSSHKKGPHGFGGIWGSDLSTCHHNLIAHHSSRNPRWASGGGRNDYRNNVVYNWGYNSSYGGERRVKGEPEGSFVINMVNNYYKPGPATQPGEIARRIVNPSSRGDDDWGAWYVAGNLMEGDEAVSRNNWNGGVQPSAEGDVSSVVRMKRPWKSMPIREQMPAEACELVLKWAGCSFPVRDAVDRRVVNDVRTGLAACEGESYRRTHTTSRPNEFSGIIDSPDDVGGWPVLRSLPAPDDTDHDGMPDDWEVRHGLDPERADDRNRMHESGYTALEVYINALCGEYVEGGFLPEQGGGSR